MLLKPTEIDKKYGLEDKCTLRATLYDNTPHYIVSGKLGCFYDEDEALEAIMSYMCHQEQLAFKKAQKWHEKAVKLEKTLDEMGCYK